MTDGNGRGRPRSEKARIAVLHAVDDLLVEVGYAAMTMKGIAERAGVGRQTVYRWWSHKAEVLYEASVVDAREELSVPTTGDPRRDVAAYLDALIEFLSRSHAGAAYRALLGEAQHDPEVARLLASGDVLEAGAGPVLDACADNSPLPRDQVAALLIGPVLFHILSGRPTDALDPDTLADRFLRAVGR
ncbi:putative transcriptional regulator, TetR family protein [Streptomyces sp. NBRC 14336]|uniref:TetR/AcrR family transcriptional regulator n=1 Tax=Streptomyces sp. NBRC 14336 TaxID=3030992 RepID=UPI0024A09634|nr:TetR/AcrR family transcriptional regulator [Streptomyces sp. NBRC 14336]WBO81258.1 TetR/AcrR family transcriptional regulator [Streptomyces sp. SBE_14.2]GLW47627.1 putative transcriptional regulator, TetR family protein [Streptomyces sp. NBRC 14336]